MWISDLRQLPRPRRLFYRGVRVWYLALRSFFRDQNLHRASALSFDTVLGLVPFLAFCVAVLKSLGVYDDLIQKSVRPWIMDVTSALGDHGEGQSDPVRVPPLNCLQHQGPQEAIRNKRVEHLPKRLAQIRRSVGRNRFVPSGSESFQFGSNYIGKRVALGGLYNPFLR